MITRGEYVDTEVEGAFGDHKFIAQILRDYYWDMIKDLSDEEFKEHLINCGYDIGEEE